MKKVIYTAVVAFAALGLASCSTIRHTSTTLPVATEMVSKNLADLTVSPKKISFTLKPSKAIARGGEKAVISAAVAEALKANGNADVLVGFQYEIKRTRNFFGKSNIKYVTVEGYPATYNNFRTIK